MTDAALQHLQGVVEPAGVTAVAGGHGQLVVHRHQVSQPADDLALVARGPGFQGAVVVEQYGADTVPDGQHPPGGQCRHFGGDHRLHLLSAAEKHRQPLVHHHHHRPVALLGVHPHMGFAGAVGDAPVHGADIVAGPVVAQLVEIQAAAPQA